MQEIEIRAAGLGGRVFQLQLLSRIEILLGLHAKLLFLERLVV
jgi:hypothetical protein